MKRLINLLLFIALKNGFRRLVMNIPSNYMSPDYQDRVRLMAEHAVFAVWGYYTVVEQPTVFHSWMFNPILCWFKPVFPSSAFMVYYTAKVAAHAHGASRSSGGAQGRGLRVRVTFEAVTH